DYYCMIWHNTVWVI
nr:immunoglobulin light chain junction region [Macaca mulatta]MOW71349.1 immunoglobulin light chain junction region [Macaca mulatta]